MVKLGLQNGMKTMRVWILAAAAGGAALALGSCATMSAEQCQAGDWSGQGYADGAAGLSCRFRSLPGHLAVTAGGTRRSAACA